MARIENIDEPWEGHEGIEVEIFVKEEIVSLQNEAIGDVELGEIDQERSTIPLSFYKVSDTDHEDPTTVDIPLAGETGTVIVPKVTTQLYQTQQVVKLGDTIRVRWTYDCIKTEDGASESTTDKAQTLIITVKLGQATIYSETRYNVAPQTSDIITIGPDLVTDAGVVNVMVVATTYIAELDETKTARSSKSVNVTAMRITATFNPASYLNSGGYGSGQSVSIPYSYNVPRDGATFKIWLDGVVVQTYNISGSGRSTYFLPVSELTAGRHNIQMLAEGVGLVSNALSFDFLKQGSTASYLGMALDCEIAEAPTQGNTPLNWSYGIDTVLLSVNQFESIGLDFGVWVDGELTHNVEIIVDGIVTQTIEADRSLQHVSQRFDVADSHTMVVKVDNVIYRSFDVTVVAAESVTEHEAEGYVNKLTAIGRSNSEPEPERSDWGGITTFSGVDWNTTGWITGSDGVPALVLKNGAKAIIDIKPFILDQSAGDYSINRDGMTIQFELMLSQVTERGAIIVECLNDNSGQGYPMGLKLTTAEAALLVGGYEEIKTADKMTNDNGNYISFTEAQVSVGDSVVGFYERITEHVYVMTTDTTALSGKTYYEAVIESDEEDAADLYIVRASGVSANIATDIWIDISYVVTPIQSDGYGLTMLYINGVLSRASRYNASLIQSMPQPIVFDSDNAYIRLRGLRYYRRALIADDVLGNWIIDRPTGIDIQDMHIKNAVGDSSGTLDIDGNIAIDKEALVSKGRGVLTVIRSGDSGDGLTDLFNCVDKKQNFKADLVRWEPPLDDNGNPIGQGFEARNIRMRIQGTSSVKYPYKNLRFYLTTAQDGTRSLVIGGIDVTDTASGYPLRGVANSIEQAVLCAKTDFVDSSLAGNTGGAHLFHNTMMELGLLTPPQDYDSRVRQAIDGIPCDIFSGTDEAGTLTYCGQFVLNNEKSKSGKIFGMEGISGFTPDCAIALETLNNSSPMTLFHPAGSADSQNLADQLAAEFDNGMEFNFPEDAKWDNVDEGQWDDEKQKWAVKPVPGARAAIKRWMGWIYDCMIQTAGVQNETMTIANPDYGTSAGWSDESKAKWICTKFKTEAVQYFNVSHLLTYYLIIDYLAGKDQLVKNILWRTWDGLKWYSTFYDGDTWEAIRNDAFIVYLYNITRDSYDAERSKYAFEGHASWLWCLVLANFETELRQCAASLRNQLTNQYMLNEFVGTMISNWSERQYNKSGKLKYIDTINTMNYVYTLTGSREAHIRAFLTNRAKLLDARYSVGGYNGDVVTLTVVRASTDTPSSLELTSGDLYYFGYKLNGIWLQGPTQVKDGETLTLNFTQTLSTNDPLMIGGASCIKEIDFTEMGSQLNGNVGLSLCAMLEKIVMPATNGAANAPLILGNISKLQYVDITGQTAVNTGVAGVLDLSNQSRLGVLKAQGTGLTSVLIPDGAPLTTLELPSTLTMLRLRYLNKLTMDGLTLENANAFTALNYADCPNLDWKDILTQCQNIRTIRVEGVSGRVRSEYLRQFMTGWNGIDAQGNTQTYPALIGTVILIDTPNDYQDIRTFFENCGLTVLESQFTEYWFDDTVSDPANITNEDNKTGYAYAVTGTTGHPNGYYPSGHVSKIRDKCQIVSGLVNPSTHKMRCEKISKTNLNQKADGTQFDPSDSGNDGYDVFLYVPKYWYKGVNNFKVGRKHLFLSANTECPNSTASSVNRTAIATLLFAADHAVDNSAIAVGDTLNENNLLSLQGYSVYRFNVEGMKQVRFPSVKSNYYSHAFTDGDNKAIAVTNLVVPIGYNAAGTTVLSPADFDNTIGDYDIREVPSGAKWLYFTAMSSIDQNLEVIAADTLELEAMEPDWVEHKSELIGIYQGFATGVTTGGTATSGLRSISGKTVSRGNNSQVTNTGWTYDTNGNPTNLPSSSLNGTAQDFFNLALYRNIQTGVLEGQYTTVRYETSKDMANLIMAWFGTRDVETIVGRGSSVGETTGVGNAIAFGDSAFYAQNQHNKMWGLECWTASTYEWSDCACFNAPSFARFKKDKRVATSSYVVDYIWNILQQDGNERRVKAAIDQQASNIARVRFGRYCDIVCSAYAGDTVYTTCYAAYQSANQNTGGVVGRSDSRANANAGVASVDTNAASSLSHPNRGARLCFFGKIENEEELLE